MALADKWLTALGHPYYEMLLKESGIHKWYTTTGECSGNYAEWEKLIFQRLYTTWWFHSCLFLKWQNHRNGNKIGDCQELGTGWGGRGMQEEVNRVIKGQHQGSCDDGSLLYLDCSGTVLIHVIELQRTKHTHTHRIVSQYPGIVVSRTHCRYQSTDAPTVNPQYP